jgi:fused signal recognition particle receptor
MFGFFRRKKNTEPAVEQPASTPSQPERVEQPQDAATESAPAETMVKAESETAQHISAEPVPAEEAPAQPAAEITEDIIVPTVVDEPAAIAVTTETASAQTPEASESTIVVPVEPAETSSEAEKPAKLGWAARLKQGLSKSRNHMAKSLASVFGGGKIDEDLYEELETVLLTSDMGIEATEKLLAQVRQRVTLKGLKNGNELRSALKEALYELLLPLQQPLILPADKKPFVIMMAGVNGAGKTTSIGKLAKYFQSQGKSVLLAAGDTFRAAAREQLQQWGERNNVTVIAQASGDSAAVCFDALEAAKARGIDVVLADTAGRLPTQLHLMEEIKKVKRVLQKSLPEAPHEVMLVLDANVGQNAINQVVAFDDALGLTGLIVSKLDGTAKGGILAALAAKRPIPVRFIGVGEGIDDLRPFDARAFVDALIEDEE